MMLLDSYRFGVAAPVPGDLLLSGDEQSGTDALLLSGDEQTGTDTLQILE
jgi:hypothetical protein